MKFCENSIESVHRQHFADSGVMIRDHGPGIPRTIVVAHANVWPADEGGVTEDDPWLLRTGKKTFPEHVKSNRRIRTVASHPGLRDSAVQEPVGGNRNGRGENDRK